MMIDMLKAVDVLHKKIHRFLIEKKPAHRTPEKL